MSKVVSCKFNMDSGCVELLCAGGEVISIDCTAVEGEIAENRIDRAELDRLIYNDPVAYADLVLNGDVKGYLRAATDYTI